jgi:hypothetical protein
LTIRARHFRAIGNVPRAVLLDDRGELVAHDLIVFLPYADEGLAKKARARVAARRTDGGMV